MRNILWHYFCRNLELNNDRYYKYLLISINSLIFTANINPQNIVVSFDIYDNDYNNLYIQKILDYGIIYRKAPIYKNHAKCTNLCAVIHENPDIDKIVQIDCDTIITDQDIENKLMQLCGPVHHTTMDWPITTVFESRDGLKHPMFSAQHNTDINKSANLLFAISQQYPDKYLAFKHFLALTFDFDIDQAIKVLSKETKMFVGYAFMLCPKMIPPSFFKFIGTLDLFFGDDEMILTLARLYSSIEYSNINMHSNIVRGSKNISDFNKFKGIIHFPVKDQEIMPDIDNMALKILSQ